MFRYLLEETREEIMLIARCQAWAGHVWVEGKSKGQSGMQYYSCTRWTVRHRTEQSYCKYCNTTLVFVTNNFDITYGIPIIISKISVMILLLYFCNIYHNIHHINNILAQFPWESTSNLYGNSAYKRTMAILSLKLKANLRILKLIQVIPAYAGIWCALWQSE